MPNAQPTTKELIAMLYERLPELFERSQQKPLTDERPAQQALEKMADNARELGLDYEPVQEPVAWMHVQGKYEEPSLFQLDGDELYCGWKQYPLYTTLPAQPAPVQEPLTDEHIERIYHRYGGNMINCARAIERAVFAAQRQWVGLTPEEIDTVYRNLLSPVQHWQLARTIKAKLKEKNT